MIFSGFGIIASQSKLKLPVIIFSLLFFFMSFFFGFRKKKLEKYSEILPEKKVKIVLLFIFSLLVIKLAVLGIPIISNNPNLERVIFMTKYKFFYDNLNLMIYIGLTHLAIIKAKNIYLYAFIMALFGLLSGFRSIMVFPFVYVFVAQGLDAVRIRINLINYKNFLYLLFASIPMVYLTYVRFGASDVWTAINLLFYRIFGMNVLNVENIVELYSTASHPNPFLLDLYSIFTEKPGFSGYVTEQFNKETFDLFQLTPTVFGEGYALLGYSFSYIYPVVFFIVVWSLFRIYRRSNYLFIKLLVSISLSMLLLTLNQGIGTYLFLMVPKLLIALISYIGLSNLRLR
jgi:hypothetical protein